MNKKLIEVKDERGIEFYLDPKIGKNNNKHYEEYVFTRIYLGNMIEGLGYQSNRIGFNADIDTMTTFIGNIIIKFQEHFNEDVDEIDCL